MSDGELEIAPDYAPDELPNEFEAVATVVIGVETTSAQARATLISLLRESEFDVTLEHADETIRTFLVTAERDGDGANGLVDRET